jgi:hypothetical protein
MTKHAKHAKHLCNMDLGSNFHNLHRCNKHTIVAILILFHGFPLLIKLRLWTLSGRSISHSNVRSRWETWVARTFPIFRILNLFYDWKEANTLDGCALSTCSWSNILVAFMVTMKNHLDFLKLSALAGSSHWSNRLGGLIVVGSVPLGCLAFKSQMRHH